MLYLYIGFPVISLILALIFRNYRKPLFEKLDNKEHPLKFLYPVMARVYDLFKGRSENAHSKISILMKQLCVKENVQSEIYLHQIKKLSSVLGIFLAICIVGMFLCISNLSDTLVTSLARAGYGEGQTSYQLDVEYGETSETVELIVEEARFTPEEILQKFDESFDGVINAFLLENESTENINSPVNLIDSYGEIKISWEIEDTGKLSVNGEISDLIEENEYVPVTLFATFSLDETSKIYPVPIVLTARSVTANELLVRNIYDSLDAQSEYESDVALPDEINGKKVSFRNIKDNDDRTFFLLGLLAAAAVYILFDKTLEEKAKKRSNELMLDFTEIVFKLSLLYEAGLSIYRAWERIVKEYEEAFPKGRHYAYMEMRLVLEKINNGVSEADAYIQFGKRCGVHQYIKLGNILGQNLSKGTRGMNDLLKQEAREAFEIRKRLARKKGEEAGTKMLVPMVMMLVVVMVIVAVPAIMSLNF